MEDTLLGIPVIYCRDYHDYLARTWIDSVPSCDIPRIRDDHHHVIHLHVVAPEAILEDRREGLR
jgi:hypothetical protein